MAIRSQITRLACVSIDLDSLPHYCRIFGLSEEQLPPAGRGAVYGAGIERFGELLSELRAPATFFAVGEDLEEPSHAATLKRAAAAGHEIGNHSYRHDYALTRRDAPTQAADLLQCAEAIRRAVGSEPKGFRAPGYTLSAPLYGALVEQGYLYDSSVFPAVPYYLAKAAAMAALSLRGRPSAAILDRARVLAAPRTPYRPDPEEPYRRGGGSVFELPIATAAGTRAPFIGASLLLPPRWVVKGLYRMVRPSPFLNLELHGIDLLDESDGASGELARRQRDLRVPAALKRERIREVLGWIAADYELVTLQQAAERLAR